MPAGIARADEPRRAPTVENLAMARDALKDGMAQRDAGDPAGALPKLHLAYTLIATPVTGYELGKTYVTLGQLLAAREAFLSVGRMPRSIEESERSETARRESERLSVELEPHVPKLRIHLTLPPGASAIVTVDGAALPDEANAAPRSVNPGTHEVTAKAGDGEPVTTKVDVRADETKDVTLAPKWVAPKPPPAPERPFYIRSSPNPVLYVGVVAGVLGSVTGTVGFVLADRERSDALKACGTRFCPPTTKDQFDRVGRYDVLEAASYSVAAAGIVLSLYAILKPKTEKVYAGIEPMIGLGNAGVRGSF